MFKITHLFSAMVFSLCCSFPSFAGQWDSMVVEVQAKPTEPVVEAVFRYTRDPSELDKATEFGPWPEGVKLLTGAVATAPLLVTEAGRKDSVDSFRFQIPVGCLSGERTISIPLINSADPKELKVVLKVPELVEIKPRLMVWEKGSAAKTKTTSIVSVTREGIVLTKVEPDDDAFEVILERQAAQLYTVKITPKDVTASKRTVLRVIGVDMHGQETSFNLYAEVR